MTGEAGQIRSVMVPLDGSPLAERALAAAVGIAEAAGARLHLVTVKPPASTVSLPLESRRANLSVDEFLEKGLSEYLAAQASALPATMRQPVQTAVLDGWAAESLAAHAHATGVDLIVMTTHGRGGFSRFWLGSVADELLRRAGCPVLLLRGGGAKREGGFRRLLVALDDSSSSEVILSRAVAIAALQPGSRCILAYVVEPPAPLLFRVAGASPLAGQRWADEAREAATHRLESLASPLRKRFEVPMEIRVVVGEGVGEQLVKLIAEVESDLTVIGTYGARGLERLLLGSVADKVVRGSSGAVLVVPLSHSSGESRTLAR